MTVRSRLKLSIGECNFQRITQQEPELMLRQIAAGSRLPSSVISGLANRRAGRVDIKTINKLCMYFQIQPGAVFECVPDTEETSHTIEK